MAGESHRSTTLHHHQTAVRGGGRVDEVMAIFISRGSSSISSEGRRRRGRKGRNARRRERQRMKRRQE